MIDHNSFSDAEMIPEGILRRVLKMLHKSPAYKEAVEAERVDNQAERDAIVSEVLAVRTELAKHLPAAKAAAEKAYSDMMALEPAYEKAAGKWRTARDNAAILSRDATWREERLLNNLEVAAASEILETTVKIRDMMADQQRNMRARYVSAGVKTDVQTLTKSTSYLTNQPAIEKRWFAMLAALRAVDELKRDIDQTNIPERCAAIIAAIPDGQEMTTIEGGVI